MNHRRRNQFVHRIVLRMVVMLCLAPVSDAGPPGTAEAATVWPGTRGTFHGYEMYSFESEGATCKVVLPRKAADGKPWVWRARFFGHEPQFDLAMLARGYHLAYCDVSGLFGSPQALERWNRLYNYLRFEHLFADRAVLEGMSRGGLMVYNWAAANPEKVAAIYADNPVCDFKSWPGGKGVSKGSPRDWQRCLEAYQLSEQEALTYDGNPIDNLAPLARAGIPILHVIGEADQVVPVAENSDLIEKRYKALGGKIEVIRKPGLGHHPHSLEDPAPIVDFVLRHTGGRGTLSAEDIVSDRNFQRRSDFRNCRIQFEQERKGHVAFLGGSITEMNGYRPMMQDYLTRRFPETDFTFTDAGISSTCSDTGAFRLERDVLSQGPLDLLFVEFAVNDHQDGFRTDLDALRGMEGIIAQARTHNPHVDIVMTFFVNPGMLELLQQGKEPGPMREHARVAAHYAVSVNHLAQELADRIEAGDMDWKKFGGVHPAEYGNRMCATMICNALDDAWANALDPGASPHPYPSVKPLDPFSYVRGGFLPLSAVELDSHWSVGVPDWKQLRGNVRTRFLGSPCVYSEHAGATMRVTFRGTAIGAYLLAGPDSAVIRCTLDGEETREMDLLHQHSGFHYPVTVMFFNTLKPGEHVLNLEVLENRNGRIKPGGSAVRILHFVVNE